MERKGAHKCSAGGCNVVRGVQKGFVCGTQRCEKVERKGAGKRSGWVQHMARGGAGKCRV
jgi:hypothetical protein